MTRRALLSLAAAAAVVSAALPGGVRAGPRECGVPPDLQAIEVRLPHLAERLHAKAPVVIVALGGGSTRGAAAGAPELAYPQRLQAALAGFYPGVPITVINKGVPRQSAQQMVDRFAADVFPAHPALVVWEVGISDAVRGIALDDFAAALQTGIDELKSRAIDIVLVDMQFSRKANAVIDFERYLETIHRIGELNEAYVFPRFALMRHWSQQNLFNLDEVAANERARLAARVYQCVGHALAEAIRAAPQ
jgi:acyl-CoA thioesterase I